MKRTEKSNLMKYRQKQPCVLPATQNRCFFCGKPTLTDVVWGGGVWGGGRIRATSFLSSNIIFKEKKSVCKDVSLGSHLHHRAETTKGDRLSDLTHCRSPQACLRARRQPARTSFTSCLLSIHARLGLSQ